MAIVSCALERIKKNLDLFLPEEAIVSACREAKHLWRQRMLGPVETIHLFILQVLCFNTAMNHLRHLSHLPVKASGYCQARRRLPLKVLEALLAKSASAMQQKCRDTQARWCGLRAYLVDGSSTMAPDTPSSQKAFGQPCGCKKGCGFPVPKLLGLFDAFTGLIINVLAFPLYTHEQSKVWMLHGSLDKGDLLVADRGFCSFVHLAMLFSRGVHGLFRIHQRQIVSFRPHRRHRQKYRQAQKAGKSLPHSRFVKRLGKWDQVVEWFKPAGKPQWMNQQQYDQLPKSLLIRELKVVLENKGQRTRVLIIATTLLDPERYPQQKIVELYGVRWRVETHFYELKITLRMRKLKSKSATGILKELMVYALVYNLVHWIMVQAAQRQSVTPDRISFIDTVRWLLSAAIHEDLPDLIINPRRPGRHEPRVVKDREDTYTKMTRPRHQLRKTLKNQPKGA